MDRVPYEPLTRREQDILALIVQHMSDREIAARLFLSYTTVKWYNRQIFRKLGVENRRAALRFAQQMARAEPPPVTRHNLPVALTPFIGREAELADLSRLLQQPHTRLLTILAPGGMGKTRLALEAAESLLAFYPNGVYFVPLAGLSGLDQMISFIAETVGIHFVPGSPPQQQLINALRRKQCLLVLDNFEHLLDCAPLLTGILHQATQVRILTTSRERLNITGEAVYPLTGLDYPETRPDAATEYSAASLFIACALRTNPRFVPNDMHSIAAICRITQGMPLAIEMAAAWVGTLTAADIAGEIARSADILKATARDVPARQQSVRAVFDTAWSRLNSDARRVFRMLSVFRGGCTREAIQSVTGASLNTLAALTDMALLWHAPHTGRYSIHELLRQYAESELVRMNEAREARHAHMAYYAQMTAVWGDAMMLDKVEEGLAALDADIENIQAAFAWGVEHGSAEETGQFFNLWLYYDLRARWGEALAQFEALIARLEPHDSITLAKLLFLSADIRSRLMLQTPTLEIGRRAAEMLRRLGDTRFLPLAMAVWADGLLARQQIDEAAVLIREAFDIARDAGHPMLVGTMLFHMAQLHMRMNAPDDAAAYMRDAYHWTKQHGNKWLFCFCANGVASICIGAGKYAEADRFCDEAMETARQLHFTLQIGYTLQLREDIAAAQHDHAGSRRYASERLTLYLENGHPDSHILSDYIAIAGYSTALDDADGARDALRASLTYLGDYEKSLLFNMWVLAAADWLVHARHYAHGTAFAAYFDHAPGTRDFDGHVLRRAADCLEACRTALSPADFAAAVARSQSMTPDAAIAIMMPLLA